jgi:C-terminal processing protease CtpA/Prc
MLRSCRLAGLACCLLLAPVARSQATDCSTLGQVGYVRDTLREYYYWYRELPDPNPALFASPEAYLEAVRYRPLDSTFSYVAAQQASQAFYGDSQYVGFGLSVQQLSQDELRVSQVFPDTPASEAGLERGARILSVNGRSVGDWVRSGQAGDIFGPAEIGYAVDLVYRSSDGRELAAHMAKRLVTIPTVSHVRVYELEGHKVGYVSFRNFVQPSFAALGAAFGQLRAAGVDELVLDLRYNGGGMVSVAQYLAELIGGSGTHGQVFCHFQHNDKNSFRDTDFVFGDQVLALDLKRLTVITTRASASASELVINSLRPFLEVRVVGDTTYGKPVGQYGFDFCGQVLYPVAFSVRNARGEGDYFGGIPADCAAPDDLEHLLGDPAEGSLAEALHVALHGTCSGGAKALAARGLKRALRLPRDGWQELVGAY